jgi:hypothetical protein
MTTHSPSSVYLRNYEELFSGSNQNIGYERPFASFEADTTLQVLKTDNITYFHYPQTALTIPLSSSGLIQDGAIAGPIPYLSDKIWKKQANYKKYIWWGNSSIPQIGTWLCSWLSGNNNDPDNQSVWMDRWYNPGYIDATDAANLPGYYEYANAVYDEPSIMTFDPGVWYKYMHIGNEFNNILVDSLSGTSGSLKLHLDNWNNPTYDESPYNNTVITQNYQDNMIIYPSVNETRLEDNCILFNGVNQDVQILYNSNLNITKDLSYSFWAKSSNWTNTIGNHLVSKNFRGGWGIKHNPGFYNPILIAGDESDGTILILNSTGKVINTKVLPASALITSTITDSNLFTWVTDNFNKKVYKVDFSGNINDEIVFDNTTDLQHLELDANENLWVLDSTTSRISGFNINTITFIDTQITTNTTKFTFDLNNTLVNNNCSDLLIDNDNNTWMLSSNTLFKNSTTILTGYNISDIECDRFDNIWVLYNDNEYLKLHTTTYDIVTGMITNISTNNSGRINFTSENENDYAWFSYSDDSKIYKTDINGNLVKFTNTAPFSIISDLDRNTTYDWNRKFNYIKNNKQPQMESTIWLGTNGYLLSGNQTISYPCSNLTNNEWHNFATTYEYNTGILKLYVDTIERNSLTVSPSMEIYYDNENNIFVGAAPGKIESLDNELNTSTGHFNGYVDDVRIYDIILTPANLWNIFMTKYDFSDLKWNMPTGMQNYLEEIERFFKFKLPGLKSQYYNIKLLGLNITDPEIRAMIEDVIKQTVKRVAPVYTELYKIIWD